MLFLLFLLFLNQAMPSQPQSLCTIVLLAWNILYSDVCVAHPYFIQLCLCVTLPGRSCSPVSPVLKQCLAYSRVCFEKQNHLHIYQAYQLHFIPCIHSHLFTTLRGRQDSHYIKRKPRAQGKGKQLAQNSKSCLSHATIMRCPHRLN